MVGPRVHKTLPKELFSCRHPSLLGLDVLANCDKHAISGVNRLIDALYFDVGVEVHARHVCVRACVCV